MYEEEMLPSRDYSGQKRRFDPEFNGDDTLPSNLLSTSVWRTLGIFLYYSAKLFIFINIKNYRKLKNPSIKHTCFGSYKHETFFHYICTQEKAGL